MNGSRTEMNQRRQESHASGSTGGIKKSFKWFTLDSIIASVIAIVIGILFIILPNSFASLLCIVLGIILIIGGIIMLIAFFADKSPSSAYALAGAIVLCSLGIFGVTHVSMIKDVLSYFFGAFIILFGSIYLCKCIENRRIRLGGSNLMPFILSLIIIILGILILFINFSAMMVATGIILACVGLAALIMTILFASAAKKAYRQNTPLDSEWHEIH